MKFKKWMASKNLDAVLNQEYEKIRPITVEYVPTLNCNFTCVQCAYKKAKEEAKTKLNSDMTIETMLKTMERLKDGGVKNVLVTGGGEPLVSPLTPHILRLSKHLDMTSALYTNGLLLTRSKIDHILESEPLFVRVSVYGGNQDVMNAYTQTTSSNTHQTVLDKIDKLAEQKKKNASETLIGLSYLVHPITADSVVEFGEKVRRLPNIEEIDYIRFTPAVEYFGTEQHSKDMMKRVFDNVSGTITEMFSDISTEIKPYYHRVNDLHQEKGYNKCLANGWFAELAPDGKMYLCCEKHFLPEYEIGDLTKNTLDEIWNGEQRAEVIKRVNDNNLRDCPTLCKPHELNKEFSSIQYMPPRHIRNAIKNNDKNERYCPGKLDNFQS